MPSRPAAEAQKPRRTLPLGPRTDPSHDARFTITLEGRFPADPLTIADPEQMPKELVGAYMMG